MFTAQMLVFLMVVKPNDLFIDLAKEKQDMIAILQRVRRSSVNVEGKRVAEIGRGWLIFLGVLKGDERSSLELLANKILNLRAFPDEDGKMNRSVKDIQGDLLVVSQFTLAANCWKGNRPGFSDGETPELAEKLYLEMITKLRESGLKVGQGQFASDMQVELMNDGPVTFILNTAEKE